MSFDDFIYLGQSNKVFIWREMGSNYGNNYGIVAGLWKYMMWEESILNKDKEGKGQNHFYNAMSPIMFLVMPFLKEKMEKGIVFDEYINIKYFMVLS